MIKYKKPIKTRLYNDSFQNYKVYNIPKAQLVIADIPYNIGENAYGSNPQWYVDGDNSNGESKLAKKSFFYSDGNFNIVEYFHFCHKLLKPEPKEVNSAPCMIVFCSWQQLHFVEELGKKYGFPNSFPLIFIKNFSSQVLKANMKIVGATEYAMVLYRDKLPKFRNDGRMIFNWFNWEKDGKEIPKIHPTQKPVKTLKKLIEIFTDPGDIVIDPVAGSASTLRAARELGRSAYGFEINKDFCNRAENEMLNIPEQINIFDSIEETVYEQPQLFKRGGVMFRWLRLMNLNYQRKFLLVG